MINENIRPIPIEQEIRNSFLDYSMSVIVSRALPDVRDGLKPVHRRILYAMHDLKNYHNKPYLKSARIVGDVIGKYHPHGDTAVYDALVRLAQDFTMRYPLIDGQGNFGSIDGDNAAAMRYTESRMQMLSEFLLTDLDKDTVDFVPNYDNKDMEPSVLPSMVPQLLINGSSGIAVGMATNIPPHNLTEILLGLKAFIHNPEISLSELMSIIRGPDFPTGAEIHGIQGIVDAYRSGRGSLTLRAKAFVEEIPKGGGRERIIVTEIPYQLNKSRLVEKIADLVLNKKIEGISDIRDESSKEGIRVVVDLKKGESGEVILNNLYKLTPLQSSFGVNLVALVKGLPKLLSLKEMLSEFFDHRKDVIVRRTAFLLKKAQEKEHILLGLKVTVDHVDDVVAIIRKSSNSEEAQQILMSRFSLSEIQSKAILDMRLGRLTGLERDKIISELKEIFLEIQDFKSILSSRERVVQMILSDIDLILEKFGDDRKTVIFSSDADELTMEALVADDEVAVTVTFGGYVKKTLLTSIASQKRGGKGKSGMLMKGEDFVQKVFLSSNHQSLLCFSDKGKVYELKIYQIPDAVLRSQGKHFANLIKLEPGERVVSVLPIKAYTSDLYISFITKNGLIKKTELMSYHNVRSTGIKAIKLDEGDTLISCLLGSDQDHILMVTGLGKSIRFPLGEIRAVGRSAMGVTGIRFDEEAQDYVIGAEILKFGSKSYILSVCERGFGKRTDLEEYRVQGRGGKGILTIKVTERNGPVIGVCQVSDEDDVMIMTSSGKLTRFSIKDTGVIGRVTQGVRLMNVADDEKVVGLSKAPAEASESEGEAMDVSPEG